MRLEYKQAVDMGNSILEVLNPSSGDVKSILIILEYNVDINTDDLVVTGIDMTKFFEEQKYVGDSLNSFVGNLTSHIEKTGPTTTKFSKHFAYTIYTK